mmetsp:Transcript_49153/g.63108  ORF Transcript_49153/g.63108 Transcript_49153/m.63108 type:complete len:159 (-) Transcript_49153:257-733(-)
MNHGKPSETPNDIGFAYRSTELLKREFGGTFTFENWVECAHKITEITELLQEKQTLTERYNYNVLIAVQEAKVRGFFAEIGGDSEAVMLRILALSQYVVLRNLKYKQMAQDEDWYEGPYETSNMFQDIYGNKRIDCVSQWIASHKGPIDEVAEMIENL